MKNLHLHVEALVFTAKQPITIKEMRDSLFTVTGDTIEESRILAAIDLLKRKYNDEEKSLYAYDLAYINGGYTFLTKPAFHETVSALIDIKAKKRLSTAAMETLSIIAYKQPITKSGIELIRGVNCDYAVQKLLEKNLVAILGRSDAPGRPLLYGTSEFFMDYFGIGSVDELPKLKDIESDVVTQVGEAEPDITVKLNGEEITVAPAQAFVDHDENAAPGPDSAKSEEPTQELETEEGKEEDPPPNDPPPNDPPATE